MAQIRLLNDLLKKTGDTMTGNLIMASGANIFTAVSGVNTIGSPSNPFEAVYANFVVSSGSQGQFVNISGDTMTGPLYVPVLSGTVISGNSLTLGNLDGVLFATAGTVSGSATTTVLPEGTNLYYTDARVNANPIVSGHSLSIAQLEVDLATISGIATTAIQSGANIGVGEDVFSGKSGTNLEFKTLSGEGNITITSDGSNVNISGNDVGSIFGSEYQKFESLDVSITTATTPQVKISGITTVLPSGLYRFGYNYGWNHNANRNDFVGNVLLDGITMVQHQQEPKDSAGPNFSGTGTNQKYVNSGFFNANFNSDTTHTLVLNFATSVAAINSGIWDSQIEVWRIN